MKKLLAVLAVFISSNSVANNCENGFVRLTFDDGPHEIYTVNILNALQLYNSKATFFVVGENVMRYPEIVKRIVKDGHNIANHTWSHPDLTKLTTLQVEEELSRTNSEIKKIVGFNPKEWRPPYEEWNSHVEKVALSLNMVITLYNYDTDSQDWKEQSVDKIVKNTVNNAVNGSIIILHDLYERTATSVPLILEGLKQKGLCAR